MASKQQLPTAKVETDVSDYDVSLAPLPAINLGHAFHIDILKDLPRGVYTAPQYFTKGK